MIPDDIKQSLDVLGLYKGISSHSFDDMEPFVPIDNSNLKLKWERHRPLKISKI